MSKRTKPLEYLVLSDIHLGARSTTADEIIEHLDIFFDRLSDKSALAKIDILFIAGDLWDDTINFSSDVLSLFLPWFHRLLKWCGRNRIKLRILEGTPRHDRQQATTLKKIAELLAIEVDFKYIPELSIEKMEDLDLTVLYVPDECRHTAEIVERDVQSLLDEHQLEQVDIGIMHGMFEHQLGFIPNNSKVHRADWYLQKVKHYINIGHIHTASQYSRILAQGSFDRLGHGEEAAKGAYLIKELPSGEWSHFFLENKHAKLYITIEIKGSIDDALKTIDKRLKTIPGGSYIRIQGLASHPIFQGFETLRNKYPLYTFSKKALVSEEETKRIEISTSKYIPIVLNEKTLTEALFSEVSQNHSLHPDQEDRLHHLLEALHD